MVVSNTPGDGLPLPKLIAAMTTLSIAMGLAVLDSSIANVALPSIATALSSTADNAIWINNAYILATVISLLPFATLGDSHGYRTVYLFGLIAFTAASLACGLCNSLASLVAARFIQGLGAAAITSVNMAIVRHIYPSSQLGRGMGLMGLVVAAAAAAGPSIASVILANLSWHWLFLVNVPLAILALALAFLALPTTPASGSRFDYVSASLSAAGLLLLFHGGTTVTGAHGLTRSACEIAGGLLLLLIFLKRQAKQAAPMLPFDLFRSRSFSVAAVTSIAAYTSLTIVVLTLPFFFQGVGGFSQTQTGLMMTAYPLALVISAPWAGRLSDRYSPGQLCTIGLVIVTVTTLGTALLPAVPSMLLVAAILFASGFGFGLFQSPNNRAFMTSAPRERSGACAGIMTTSRLLGQAAGGVVVTLSFSLSMYGGLGISAGARWALGAAIAFAIVATATSATRLGHSAPTLQEP